MTQGARITRTVDTDLDAEQLWSLVADDDGWAGWMVDEADVDVSPGATGRVVDDGVERVVHIERIGDHDVTFTWWPPDRPELASAVELVVLPAQGGSRLQVTETALRARAAGPAAAWDVRLMLLVASALVVHV
jgi:uncharacterized protein YndB with AHSA1/START domain